MGTSSFASFSLTGVLGLGVYFRGVKPDVECHVKGISLRFLCASYRSLYLLSSLSLVRLCSVLFLVTTKIIPTSLQRSCLVQCLGTHHFQNAYIFSSNLAHGVIEGLNPSYLISVVSSKMIEFECAPNGLGIIFSGRIKGQTQTRFVPKMNALSLSSFRNRILDIGIMTSLSRLGLLGVKVGTIQ